MSKDLRVGDQVVLLVTQKIFNAYDDYKEAHKIPPGPWGIADWLSKVATDEVPKAKNQDVPFMQVEKEMRAVFAHDRWEALLTESIAAIKALSTLKGGEYAGDTDRLANFRRNAEAMGEGTTMEEVWRIYVSKHWDAIMQYEQDLRAGRTRPRLESLSGRADDVIVYMLLFKAMLQERGEK